MDCERHQESKEEYYYCMGCGFGWLVGSLGHLMDGWMDGREGLRYGEL